MEWGAIDWRGSERCTVLLVESSNRHIHLSAKDFERLFGKGHEMVPAAPLAGIPMDLALLTGFASRNVLDVVNVATGKTIKNVRVLGPCRELTQVELAYTDCRTLGINAPTRISGDTKHSAPCRLVNATTGVYIDIPEGVIRAWRHVHMSHAQAYALDVDDRDLMALKITSPGNTITFHDVMVRIMHGFDDRLRAELYRRGVELRVMVHLDTDEANAAMLQDATAFELFKQKHDGSLTSVIRTHGKLETNASRRDGRIAWQLAEAMPRPDGVAPPRTPSQMRAEPHSKL